MKDLFEGIYTHFSTTSASSFYSGVGGRMYLEQAPEGTQFPYAVYGVVNEGHDWNFTNDYEEVVLDFNLFADDELEVATLYEKLKEAYDDSAFTVSNHSLLKFRRDNAWLNVHTDLVPNMNIWQYTVQYSCLLRKST